MRERYFGRIVWAIPLIVIQVPRVIFKGKHRDVGGLEFQSGGTRVKGAIDRLEEGCTEICVAHRLSTLRGMDKIMVIETGRVEEKGNLRRITGTRWSVRGDGLQAGHHHPG